MPADPRHTDGRPGAALPLALFALVTVALLVSLLLDGALQEYRSASGDFAGVRASAAAEREIAVWLTTPVDSAVASLPRGASWTASAAPVPGQSDTVVLALRPLGGGIARLTISARVWSDGVRADAGAAALVRFERDSAASPATYRARPLTGWWWTPFP